MELLERDKARFAKYYDVIGDCWLWKGGANVALYGIFFYKKRTELAHRVAYKLYVDPNIKSSDLVLHNCTCKNCVNPAHLMVGNALINNRDHKKRDGKLKEGASCHFAKLTDARVTEMRGVTGKTKKEIASMYDISVSTVGNILAGRTWKNLL
jgi:hypothetical protein